MKDVQGLFTVDKFSFLSVHIILEHINLIKGSIHFMHNNKREKENKHFLTKKL
jgi:hypothetical protein